jgi:Mor family transcriptional regulator
MAERVELQHVSAAELEPLERLFDPKYPDRLREMATVLFLELKARGTELPPHELALALTERVSLDLGGGQFYMHKGSSYRLAPRDREIAAEYRGWNLGVLAKKHNLTEMRIRQIVDQVQREAFESRQGKLLVDGEQA